MPRKHREDFAGAVHHIFALGVDGRPIFVDDLDRRSYLEQLAEEIARREWRCLSYCLMRNHVHLLLETPQANLSVGMQRLHGTYAQRFNRRHDRRGHLWAGRFGSKRIEDDAQMWMTVGYIARNPIEAKIVRAAGDWPWSSHAATAGQRPAPAWLDQSRLLDYLGALGGDPRQRYKECVEPGSVTASDAAASRPPESARLAA